MSLNGALRQSKSKRCNYTKVGKCRLSAGRHFLRSYPGIDSGTGEGLSRITPRHGSCKVGVSLTVHQLARKWDCPLMLCEDVELILDAFDSVYMQLG